MRLGQQDNRKYVALKLRGGSTPDQVSVVVGIFDIISKLDRLMLVLRKIGRGRFRVHIAYIYRCDSATLLVVTLIYFLKVNDSIRDNFGRLNVIISQTVTDKHYHCHHTGSCLLIGYRLLYLHLTLAHSRSRSRSRIFRP